MITHALPIERAVLVHVTDSAPGDDFEEFRELVHAAGAETVADATAILRKIDPKLLIGLGKVEEIKSLVTTHKADLVLFNHALTPSQQRNLEAFFQARVLDRTDIILDIFAKRARTFEGKLQVELAQLQHLVTRLVRGWTHLERQKGGIGLRGPGETQLETDRRLVRNRIKVLKTRLEKVRSQRGQSRAQRHKHSVPTVSLVGYTNAGKSTLFNRLTGSEVFVANQLFATLDPTLRECKISGAGKVVLADTVGFISHLPHKLVDAFHATLEETADATLLLHVINGESPLKACQVQDVEAVLQEIEAATVPVLKVMNKIDTLPQIAPRIDRDEAGHPTVVWLSARTGEGMALLHQAIAERLAHLHWHGLLQLRESDGALRAHLYESGLIISESFQANPYGTLVLSLTPAEKARLTEYYMIEVSAWQPIGQDKGENNDVERG